jgi:glycerol kinase
MQFQADGLGVPVVTPAVPETTSFGAAMPWGADERETLLEGWSRALERARGWASD